MIYRKLSKNDAARLWEMMNRLDYETKYMLYEPGERAKDLTRIETLIQNASDDRNFLLVAEDDGNMVGYVSAQKGALRRNSHAAYVVVGILKDYRGCGIGTEFFKRLDRWAEEQRVVRLELTVVCENQAAIQLYDKFGFETEGVKRKSLFVDGRYLDEFYMAKIK